MSYTKLLYHIIIRTKNSKPILLAESSEELYRYIWGFIKNKKCVLYRINGMPEHIHMLVDVHPTISLSNFVKELKVSTHSWLDKSDKFPHFESWGEKYAALTCSYSNKDIIVEYIKNQREHHKKLSFQDEYRKLIEESGVEIDDKFFLND